MRGYGHVLHSGSTAVVLMSENVWLSSSRHHELEEKEGVRSLESLFRETLATRCIAGCREAAAPRAAVPGGCATAELQHKAKIHNSETSCLEYVRNLDETRCVLH